MSSASSLVTIRAGAAIVASAGRSAPGVAVAACGDWTIIDLVAHLGRVHGWAAASLEATVRAQAPDPPDRWNEEVVVNWAESQTQLLLDTLERTDLDRDCWTFGLPRSGRFWLRRIMLETAVHSWDAQDALGGARAIDPELAADGIDEFLELMLPRAIGRNPQPWNGETVHLHRTDGEGEWIVTLGPHGSSRSERGHAKGDLAVRASASDLYLWCLNRSPTGSLKRFGDEAIAERWSEEIAF